MNGFQKAVLAIAGGLTVILGVVVIVRLKSIDPNGAVNVLVGAVVGLVASGLAAGGRRKDKD